VATILVEPSPDAEAFPCGDQGYEVPVSGLHRGNCISFAFAATTRSGDAICSFTGLLRDDAIETMWFVIADGQKEQDRIIPRGWAHAVTTNHDTFTRSQ
jgi:hypothetical protein